uniref:UspA domain-containing protein n=1 Tax=Aegilops tauschii subsp. strangulata TaxID=200361 RepID=A0A453PSU7_AEGTS
MDQEEVHIAVGKNFKREKANILWAAANFPRATLVLVNVHWPSKWMPFSKISSVKYFHPLYSSNSHPCAIF